MVKLDISRMLVYRFAWLMSQEKTTREDAAVLRFYSGEAYKTASDLALRILAGCGYCLANRRTVFDGSLVQQRF